MQNAKKLKEEFVRLFRNQYAAPDCIAWSKAKDELDIFLEENRERMNKAATETPHTTTTCPE